MATLYITELQHLPQFSNSSAQAPVVPGVAEQHLTISGSSTASAAFNSATRFVMVNTDSACSLAWSVDGTDPTAVATAQRMGANETRFYGVREGGKVAVISNS